NALDHFWRHPVGVATGIALIAPAIAHRVAAGDRHTVNQNQSVLRPHAADINLAVIPALSAVRVPGEIDARHGANDLSDVALYWPFFNGLAVNDRDAGGLERLFFGRHDHGFAAVYFFVAGSLFLRWVTGVCLFCFL